MDDAILTTDDKRAAVTLRAAVKRINDVAIPHVVIEDEWVGRWAADVKGIVYTDRRVWDGLRNIRHAIRWFREDETNSLFSSVFRREGKLDSIKGLPTLLRLAWYSLTLMERNVPDAEVNGNLVHWMEHSYHIALWSPEVANRVAEWLDAEAEVRERGESSASSAAAVALAEQIIAKKIWDNTVQDNFPKVTLVGEVLSLIPSRAREKKRRLMYMRDHGVSGNLIHAFADSYAHQSAHAARKNAQRMLARAERALASATLTDEDRVVWQERSHSCRVFIASLMSRH